MSYVCACVIKMKRKSRQLPQINKLKKTYQKEE
jgi:hypothetical protein